MTNFKTIVAAGIIGIALILGAVAYSVFRAPATTSGPIEAIPIAASAAASQPTTAAASPSAEATAAPAPTDAAATADPASESAASLPSGSILAQIVPAESEARFIIDEVLNDAPKTVIGATNQVAGEIAVDPNDPTKSQVGIIQVNARALTTDNHPRCHPRSHI
jgi:hypothetical protein